MPVVAGSRDPFPLDDLVVNRDADVPIGVQLAWALRARIGDGTLAPGQRLPGLRDLAEALGVNANTVRAVYQRLEHDGIVESQQGSGTFVAATLSASPAAGMIAAQAAREARDTGVNPRDVAAALYVGLTSSAAQPLRAASAARLADTPAARRRQLRTQIAALERTLGELEARHPALAPPPAALSDRVGPRLLDVAELENVQAQLLSRLAALQAAVNGLGSVQTGDPVEGHAARAATTAGEAAGGAVARAVTDAVRPASKRATRTRAKARPAPAGA